MVYSRKHKKRVRVLKKNTISKKRNNKKYKKISGGGCGCGNTDNSKTTGGSAYLTELSPHHYYKYYDVTKDPNNLQISTSIPSNTLTSLSGGSGSKRKSNKKTYKKRRNVKKQKGGLSGADFVSSFENTNLTNNMSNYLVGSQLPQNPDYMQNVLSVNQYNPNALAIPPGIKYYV